MRVGRPGALAALIFVLGALPQFFTPALPDVAWLLYVARRMLGGARLYVDLVEVNPPLIVWLNLVPAGLARSIGVPEVLAYRVLVVLAAGGSWLLCRSLLGRLREPAGRNGRTVLLLLAAVALVPLAAQDFGEREHLLLIFALPYVMLVAVRLEGVRTGSAAAVLVGLLAGIGIALKPYFVLLPLALEAWLFFSRRRLLRPEIAAMVAVGAAYLVAAQLWAAPYWGLSRALASAYYGFLQEPVLLTALTGQGAGLALCALLAYAVLREPGRERPLATALLLATAALYLSAVLQRKGWRYHFYPAMGTGLLLLGLLASDRRRGEASLARRVYRAVAVALVIFLPVSLLGAGLLHLLRPATAPMAGDPDLPLLAEVVRREGPASGLLVLSTNMASSFPLVTETGARWTSRFPSVWLLAADYAGELTSPEPLRYRPAAKSTGRERYLVRAVAEDFVREKPGLLVVLRQGPDRPEWGIRRLDYLGYFGQDSAFSSELKHYRFVEDVGEYRIYRRGAAGTEPLPAPAPVQETADVPAVTAIHPGLRVAPPGPGMLLAAGVFLVLVAVAYRWNGGR